ncbi:MAG: ABC transporter ATP-binding protein [Planctomycetes bacterium]|nr:ABC transporter ATP-binding protein [Planctomycetota bacterium]
MTEPAIRTRGLQKIYRGKKEALKPLDLEVPVGSCFGLLGPNGAGKSTLVKALLSIVRSTAGEASLLGVDFREISSRKNVGYLPEGHQFPPYLSGRGVCRYFGKLAGARGAELERDIDEKLELVGMTDRQDVRMGSCSKGMKQRIGLAQAMLGSPKLVFLDEPTDGVDPQGRAEIREVISKMAATGTTVFLNSHLLAEVEKMCDRIAILDDGKLIQQGTVAEITAIASSKQVGLMLNLRVGVVPDALKRELETAGAIFKSEGRFQIVVADASETTPLIDRLRRHQVEIFAVEPKTTSLEEAFIDLIREGSQDRGNT